MLTTRPPKPYLSDLLSEWRIAINIFAMLFGKAGRRIPKHRPVHLFGEPNQWVDTARNLGVTLDKRLTWSTHVDQVRKKAAQRLGILRPLLHRRSGLSIYNGGLLYKQLIRPMMNYACPVWRSAERSHYQETAGAAVQVSALCYQCTLVHC
jgi:hypothetical protein